MNPFDLGAEVFIVPALWGILIVTVAVMLARSFKRIVIEVEGEDGFELTKWKTDKTRLRRATTTLIVGGLVLSSLVVVPPGHRGALYTTSGVSVVERGEGYSVIVPIIHNVSMVNVREQLYTNSEVYGQTSDVLEVTMQVGVNYRINPELAADIFKEVGQQYESAIIENAVLDIAKQVIGNYDASVVPTSRLTITADMQEALTARLAPVGIDVTFVALRDIILPKSFVQAVEAKEVAAEQVIESQRLVEKSQNEALQRIETATGEATAIAIEAQAKKEEQELLGMSSTEYVWFKTWNGILPTTLLGGSDDFIVNLP